MSLHRLIVEILGRDRASDDFRKVSGQADQMARSFGSLSGVMQAAGVAGFGYLAKQAGEAIFELGKLGAESLRLESSFEELARQAGGSGDAIVAAVKRATDGTVAEMDIIQSVNRGILLGLGAQADQWEELSEVARFRARAMGISMTQALGDITTAIGRESRMIADNLGIIWDMDSIMNNYAATLGKTADQLTQSERKQALLNDTIRIGQEQIAAAGGISRDAADDIEAMGVAVQEAKTAIGEALAPAVAAAAGAFADWLPRLQETSDQLYILSSAATDWAVAALKGEDANAAFSASFAASIGNEEAAAQILQQAAQQKVAALQEEMNALLAARDAGEAVLDVHIAQVERALEAAKAELDLATQTGAAARVASESVPPWERHVGTLDKVTEAAKAAAFTEAQLADIAWRANNIIRKGGADIYEYRRGLLMEQGQVDPLEQIIDLNEQIPSLMKDNEAAVRSMGNTWENTMSNLRSTIESALQPTSVTALDMEQTALGTYADKWDEDARRLDAIAARGFAELQAHPDWAGILQIPPEVLQGSEETLKSWAQRTSGQVRNLMRPDLLADNVEQMADVVEQFIRDQEAREVTIDLVIGELQSRGFTEAMARKQVEQLMGGEGAMALGLPEEDLEGVSLQGDEVAKKLLAGYKEAISETTPIADFARHVIADIGKQHDVLSNAGRQAWRPIWESMREAIQTTPILSEIALAVSPYVARILQQQGIF